MQVEEVEEVEKVSEKCLRDGSKCKVNSAVATSLSTIGQIAMPVKDVARAVLYFKVDDIDAAYAEFKERGVDFRDAPHLIAKMRDHELWMAFFSASARRDSERATARPRRSLGERGRDGEGNTLALMCEKR